jgi:hypothetical protein
MTNARAASDPLTLALLNLAARGERTDCSDPASHYLWLSEHDNERAVAAMLCDHCPVLQVCRDTAEQRDERWGVWGGRTEHQTRKKEGSMTDMITLLRQSEAASKVRTICSGI